MAEAKTDLNGGRGPNNIVCYADGSFMVYENEHAAIQEFGKGDQIRVDIDFDSEQIVFFKNGETLCKADGIRRGVTLFPFASCAGGAVRLIRVSSTVKSVRVFCSSFAAQTHAALPVQPKQATKRDLLSQEATATMAAQPIQADPHSPPAQIQTISFLPPHPPGTE